MALRQAFGLESAADSPKAAATSWCAYSSSDDATFEQERMVGDRMLDLLRFLWTRSTIKAMRPAVAD